MTPTVTRHFLTVGQRQIHFRRSGRGPPVIVLHQSPTSSRECEPVMRRLAEWHSVYAPDMPGYGASEPLAADVLSMENLADNVLTFMDALGLEKCGFYGFHTGASIANAFARRHPERVTAAVLAGLLCLTSVEREEFIGAYVPDFVPVWDGSHLARLWSRIKDQSLYFPWYRRTAAARMQIDGLDAQSIHLVALDWLRAGEGYSLAYRAAFHYQPEIDLPDITTPHFILGYPQDPLFSHLARLPALPPWCQIRRCDSRQDALDEACRLLQQFSAPHAAPPVVPARPMRDRTWADYLTVAGIQLRVLRTERHGAAPMLLLHDAQGSVDGCRGLIEESSHSRSMIALELPGHGESDSLPDGADYAIETLAEIACDATELLGVDAFDLIGIGAGASIGVALASRTKATATQLLLCSVVDFEDQAVLGERLLSACPDDVSADFFGGHLLRAWHETRDQSMYFPWFERRWDAAAAAAAAPLDPQYIQRRTLDALLAGAAGYAVRKAQIRYPLVTKLRALPVQVRIAASRTDPRFFQSRALAASAAREFLSFDSDALHVRFASSSSA